MRKGNIGVHIGKDRIYMCHVCKKAFAERRGTMFHGLRTDEVIVTQVVTLLGHGCPRAAIVAAYGYDERTVKNWEQRAGAHSESVHEHVVGGSKLDLQHVQADEIRAKIQGTVIWIAMAMMVSTRLWLGGAISPRRDKKLIQRLAEQIQAIALCRPLVLAVDGLPSYVGAFRRAFRAKLPRRGRSGRCQWVPWPDIAIVQMVKQRADGVLRVERRIVQGCAQTITSLRQSSQGIPGVINTAYIERFNATFRARFHPLARRSRSQARQAPTLHHAMFLIGCLYNFCDYHKSLRVRLWVGSHHYRWVQRTPTMATGLTEHRWSVHELLSFKVPLPQWQPPRQRGRPSQQTLRLIQRWCPTPS
ncbi:MAG: IS1 family transposase [Halieaceae bacterium]|nr:IS1 family transposase [Halieaceae bacterium]